MSDELETAAKAVEQTFGDRMNAYGIFTWVWVTLFSLAGGLSSFFAKLKRGDARPFNLVELLGELFISFFVGILTFLFCEAAGIDELLAAGLVGLTSHMGSRALYRAEKLLAAYIEQRFHVQIDDDDDPITERNPKG